MDMKPSKKTTQKKISPAAATKTPGTPLVTTAPAASQPVKPAVGLAQTLAPAPTAMAPEKPVTVVKAKVNVGFGNTVYIRGQGCGLSWDKGVPLVCLDASSWVWSTDKVTEKISFKLLVNDQVWAQGADLAATPGEQVEAVPVF